jgi:uncharacterized membrane protein
LGLAIAVVANSLTGVSFVIKKQGLDRCDQSHTWSYLKEPRWWAGFVTMLVGEIGNFAAYAYAPAILVTPLGALSVFVNAFLSHHVLQEIMSMQGHLGMFMCAIGTALIVTFAPEEVAITSMLEVEAKMNHWVFGVFFVVSLLAVASMLYVELKYSVGLRHILFYIMLCSVVGSLLVLGIKGLGIAIRTTMESENQFSLRAENRLTYICVIMVALCLVSQLTFLNKALDAWGAARVVPIYYVTFTTLTVAGNTCLYRNLVALSTVHMVCFSLGTLATYAGVVLVGKDVIALKQSGKRSTKSRPDDEVAAG